MQQTTLQVPLLLSASPDLGEFVRGVAVPLAAFLVLVVGGWFGIRWIGKWSRADEADRVPFSLEELRRMRREGEITEAEFERAREQMLAAAKRPAPTARDRAGAPAAKARPDAVACAGASPKKAPVNAPVKAPEHAPAASAETIARKPDRPDGSAAMPIRPVPPAVLQKKATPPQEQ